MKKNITLLLVTIVLITTCIALNGTEFHDQITVYWDVDDCNLLVRVPRYIQLRPKTTNPNNPVSNVFLSKGNKIHVESNCPVVGQITPVNARTPVSSVGYLPNGESIFSRFRMKVLSNSEEFPNSSASWQGFDGLNHSQPLFSSLPPVNGDGYLEFKYTSENDPPGHYSVTLDILVTADETSMRGSPEAAETTTNSNYEKSTSRQIEELEQKVENGELTEAEQKKLQELRQTKEDLQ